MQQILQIMPEDDIASIRTQLENADLSHVVLVIARGCVALETDRGLQLPRRAAEDAGVQVALVVHDYEIRDRAAAFGFPLFHSIAQAQRARWRMEPLEREVVQGTPKRTLSPRDLYPASPTDLFKRWWGVVISGIAALAFLCCVAVVFVPAASVKLVTAPIALSLTTDALADASITQVNSELRAVPARRITREVNGTLTIKTTTEKSIPNAPSTGTVLFSNLRTEETLVPQGTVVVTSAGVPIRFSTVTTVTIPAGINSRVEAQVRAVDPGPSGNVKELAINVIEGPLAVEARVINLKPTTSGTLKPVKVVTADDKKKVQAQLLQQLQQQGNAALQQALQPGEFIPPESIVLDVNDEIYDRVLDDPADALNLRMTASAFGLALDREDMNLLARSLLGKQVQAGYQLLPSAVQVEARTGGQYQPESILFRLPVQLIGYATPQVNTGQVASALQGKTIGEASRYLSSEIPLARPPDIRVTPFGWNRLPWIGFRIAVFVEPQAIDQ